MIYRMTIEGHSYQVEINDIHARPVIAIVDGTPVEVMPVQDNTNVRVLESPPPARLESPTATNRTARVRGDTSAITILAPIPGTVVSVSVSAGDSIVTGQEVCAIEAMKMKNTIRSNRDGVVAAVKVAVGQTVLHRQVLVELVEG